MVHNCPGYGARILAAAWAAGWACAPALAQPDNRAGPTAAVQAGAAQARISVGPIEPDDKVRAQVLADVLPHLRMAPGLQIAVAASVPGARQMAVWPGKPSRVAVGTMRGAVWLVDGLEVGAQPQVRRLAPGLPLRMPHGVCWSPAGELWVVEQNRVLAFSGLVAVSDGAGAAVPPEPRVRVVVPQGQLIPTSEESGNHSARVCQVGPDGWVTISLGQPYNVPPRDKLALYAYTGIGGIIRISPDGLRREVVATGVRNSVGLAFHPADGSLWFTDNQTDGMGDDLPHGEINRAEPSRKAQFFGYPWVCGQTRITEHGYDREPVPPGAQAPQVLMAAHAADLGLAFYLPSGAAPHPLPSRWHGGLFSAQHGSWNRSTPVGAQVMWTPVAANGSRATGPAQVIAQGWLDPDSSRYRGRPVDVAPLPDGSLLVSDDASGALWRISAAPSASRVRAGKNGSSN